MSIKSQQAENSFLFISIYLCGLSLQPTFATQLKEVITTDIWAATATVFKLVGEKVVNNVKLNWMQREDADLHRIYRDRNCIGEAKGNTYGGYNLKADKTLTYHVEAFKKGKKIATPASQQATIFTPNGETKVYDSLNGKYITKESAQKPQGMKIGELYFFYKIENTEKEVGRQTLRGWLATESPSPTGFNGSWSTSHELVFYSSVKFEGTAFRYNVKAGKVILSVHYEDQSRYVAAKACPAQITPEGEFEAGAMERPLGYDSRDQSFFINDDGTAYLLSAINMNRDMNIYKLNPSWIRPALLANTICKGLHRETPAVIKKDGEYYSLGSKIPGWYPSRTMYTSAADLGGEWTPVREVGNNSTSDIQFSRINTVGETCGVWGYHWGAQRKYKTPAGNFPRTSIAISNKGYASVDYYRYLEFSDKYGIIPVQNGKNLTLNVPMTAAVPRARGIRADCTTDGACIESSTYFQKSSNAATGSSYILIIDARKKAVIPEIDLSIRLVNGSEAAYEYTIEGSQDGRSYKMLVDGRLNWQAGLLILNTEDPLFYRYLRLCVYSVTNVHKNDPAMWADSIYEFAAYGKPQ